MLRALISSNRIKLPILNINMSNLPPRKSSICSKSSSKQGASPLQILLQMGFPKHRALKALAATGHKSVQLASDWLLTHVNDAYLDADEPREYILYASPTGPLLSQLHDFWEKSKTIGWNGAHNFPPHITLVSFFKAPDDISLQLAKGVKHVVESVGDPPTCLPKLEHYISQNFMGLFISEEHAEYLKKIAVQFVNEVSSTSAINLEAHIKSLHITLAYHFAVSAFEPLKTLVTEMPPLQQASWEIRLYSRDPRFANHQVYKVIQGYSAAASDELELVLGDYIYMEEKELDNSQDGWVHGCSWLTGVSGYLPAVYTTRTAEADAWTLHRAVSISKSNGVDLKSESDSTDGEMTTCIQEDASQLGHEKSEESYKEWHKYWQSQGIENKAGIVEVTQGSGANLKAQSEPVSNDVTKNTSSEECSEKRRWLFAMRHGERVDLTYGQWVPHCFTDDGKYLRKDLNMPLTLAERKGGKDAYMKDTPLTRVGRLQAHLVGEGLRLAGVQISHVYASPALRCVETAQGLLDGLQADKSLTIKVEPGLFEYKLWHMTKGLAFMTPKELHKAGLNVDLKYKPYVEIDTENSETLEDCYKRNEIVYQSAAKDTEAEGGNIIFVGHAATLDLMVIAFKRMSEPNRTDFPPYQIQNNLLRVPYCALGAVKDKPWQVVPPPCPSSMNSSSGRFDWKMLSTIWSSEDTGKNK